MRQHGGLMAPPEVAARLLEAGAEERNLGANRSYLYVSLKKLAAKGLLQRRGKKYRIAGT